MGVAALSSGLQEIPAEPPLGGGGGAGWPHPGVRSCAPCAEPGDGQRAEAGERISPWSTVHARGSRGTAQTSLVEILHLVDLPGSHRSIAQPMDRALRRMGHDVIGMEQYVAEGSKPVDRCKADVRASDAYVLILAWALRLRPGPDRQAARPAFDHRDQAGRRHSSTGSPYSRSCSTPRRRGPRTGSTRWAARRAPATRSRALRASVGADYLAGIFRTPDDLASQVAAAVSAQGLTRGIVDRVLRQTSIAGGEMDPFGTGQPVNDSSLPAMKSMIEEAGASPALVLEGRRWWSTRLFLLASLLRSLTAVRQVVFQRSEPGSLPGRAVGQPARDHRQARRPSSRFWTSRAGSLRRHLPHGGQRPEHPPHRRVDHQRRPSSASARDAPASSMMDLIAGSEESLTGCPVPNGSISPPATVCLSTRSTIPRVNPCAEAAAATWLARSSGVRKIPTMTGPRRSTRSARDLVAGARRAAHRVGPGSAVLAPQNRPPPICGFSYLCASTSSISVIERRSGGLAVRPGRSRRARARIRT